jgi:hypothetical protein
MENKGINDYIVITSIFAPTEAVRDFAALKDYQLVVVGDKKTPADWNFENVVYLSVEKQQSIGRHLVKILPYNHYCRKMTGYLFAVANKAEYIIDTDDDNIPKSNWGFPAFRGEFQAVTGPTGFVNIYQLYTAQKIWPRGLPLNLINTDFSLEKNLKVMQGEIGIWQGLADEDPDVDAIYRLTSDKPCYFNHRDPVMLDYGTVTPFNTQNTKVRKELFPLLYLPTYVTFRFTDILRGLIAQPIMWLYGYRLGFTNATVVQKRNPHDYMKDFTSEIPMYEHSSKITGIVQSAITVSESIENNLWNAYSALEKRGIVEKQEITTLEAWLRDLGEISL